MSVAAMDMKSHTYSAKNQGNSMTWQGAPNKRIELAGHPS